MRPETEQPAGRRKTLDEIFSEEEAALMKEARREISVEDEMNRVFRMVREGKL